jgi:DNA adenine methylase
LKWAGGKIKLLPLLRKLGIEQGERYIEPFVGAGSIALNMPHKEIIINDSNDALVNVYHILWAAKDKLIDDTFEIFALHNKSKDKGKFYYDMRALFNELNENNSFDNESAAGLFLYLNRHCFNGLCRFNKKGEFNVPYGGYKTVYFPEKELLHAIEVMKKTRIYHGDFIEVMKMARKNDMIFLDPPYCPVSKTSSFTTYSKDGFTLDDQKNVLLQAECAAGKGATVIICNNDAEFTRKLYNAADEIYFHDVQKNISCKGNGRKKQREIIAVYRPRELLTKYKKSYRIFLL